MNIFKFKYCAKHKPRNSFSWTISDVSFNFEPCLCPNTCRYIVVSSSSLSVQFIFSFWDKIQKPYFLLPNTTTITDSILSGAYTGWRGGPGLWWLTPWKNKSYDFLVRINPLLKLQKGYNPFPFTNPCVPLWIFTIYLSALHLTIARNLTIF